MMFAQLQTYAESVIVIATLALLFGPIVLYLIGPWRYRRDEIRGCIAPVATQLYFAQFHPDAKVSVNNASAAFARFYTERFGRRHYLVPIVVLAAIVLGASVWAANHVLVWVGLKGAAPGALPPVAVAALTGAYIWIVSDMIQRWRDRDLLPADIYSAALRLFLAAPLGLAVAALLNAAVGVPVAFLLGAFPTASLGTMARRLANRYTQLGDVTEPRENELEDLQGVNTRIAERFADEGITSVVQLAYADPVELTMRCAGMSFSFVVDCQSQALAWLYFEKDLMKLRKYSLRGAQESANLVHELDGQFGIGRDAKATLHSAANVLDIDADAFERTLREIEGDPYTKFICEVWCDIEQAEPSGNKMESGGHAAV